MNKVSLHICKQIVKPHKPELNEKFEVFSRAMKRANFLAKQYHQTVFVNWYIGKGWAYQVLENGEVRKYSTRK